MYISLLCFEWKNITTGSSSLGIHQCCHTSLPMNPILRSNSSVHIIINIYIVRFNTILPFKLQLPSNCFLWVFLTKFSFLPPPCNCIGSQHEKYRHYHPFSAFLRYKGSSQHFLLNFSFRSSLTLGDQVSYQYKTVKIDYIL